MSHSSGVRPLAAVSQSEPMGASGAERRERDRRALLPVLAAGLIALSVVALIGFASEELGAFSRDTLAIGAALVATSIALRSTSIADEQVRHYRGLLVAATLLWLTMQLARTLGRIGDASTPWFVLESACLAAIAVVTVMMWRPMDPIAATRLVVSDSSITQVLAS